MKLRTKISCLVAVSFFTIGSVAAVMLGGIVASKLEGELEQRGIIAAGHATATIARHLVDDNLLGVTAELEEFLRNDPDARYLYVIGFDGEVAADTFGEGFPSNLLEANVVPEGAGRRLVRITLGGEHVSDIGFKVFANSPAEVHYGLSERPIEQTVRQLRTTIFMLTMVGTLVGVSVVILVTNLFTRPLVELARRVTEFGATGTFRPQGTTSGDEVGQLGTAFDDMAASLRETMEDVARSEERYRTLVELAREGVVQMDEREVITFVNRSLVDMLGCSRREDLLGRPFAGLLDERSRENYLAGRVSREEGSGGQREVTFRRGDGASVTAIFSGTPMHGEGGKLVGFFAVITDITGRRKAEEEIRKANEDLARQNLELSALDKMKDSLIRDVTHELKTPVAKQAMQIEMLKDRIGRDGAAGDVAGLLETMEKSVRRQDEVIRNILNLCRLESGGRTYRREMLRLDELLGSVLEDYRESFTEEALVLKTALSPVTVVSDREMLWHVFSNLVNNAFKFRSRSRELVLAVSLMENRGRALAVISDNGVGLGEEERGRVFERFYQASPSSEGSGVGLAIVKKIVEDLGGEVRLESPGRDLGVSAVVTLPAAELLLL